MKWNKSAKEGIVVAGGHGPGTALNQLTAPAGIYVDTSGTIYASGSYNKRVTRWPNGAKQGTIIAGGNGGGLAPNQFRYPLGLCFDRHFNLYVSDLFDHRVQRFDIQ